MSGGFNPINIAAQVGLGVVTGGSSIALQIGVQLGSQVIKQAISEVGQQLGIPQPFIDAAETAFDAASGNYAAAAQDGLGLGLSLGASLGAALGSSASSTEVGRLQSQVDDLKNTVEQITLQQAQRNAQSSTDEDGGRTDGKSKAQSAAAGGGSGSWLRDLAEVLGKKLNQVADEFKQDASAVDWKDAEAATDFQAETQELGMFFQSVSAAIKSVGEGEKALATRQ